MTSPVASRKSRNLEPKPPKRRLFRNQRPRALLACWGPLKESSKTVVSCRLAKKQKFGAQTPKTKVFSKPAPQGPSSLLGPPQRVLQNRDVSCRLAKKQKFGAQTPKTKAFSKPAPQGPSSLLGPPQRVLQNRDVKPAPQGPSSLLASEKAETFSKPAPQGPSSLLGPPQRVLQNRDVSCRLAKKQKFGAQTPKTKVFSKPAPQGPSSLLGPLKESSKTVTSPVA